MSDRLLVLVPAWNEEPSVGNVVEAARREGLDVLVVDDGSTDRTAATAESSGAFVLRLPINLGVGAALRCGFRYALQNGYDAVVQVDADGQHPVESIWLLREDPEARGADLVIGSRFSHEHEPGMDVGRVRRRVMSMLARSASRACATTISDATSGFRIIRRPLLDEFAQSFPTHYLGDTYEALVSAGRGGYKVREVPVMMRDRAHGRSSASPVAAIRFTLRAVIVAAARLHFPIGPSMAGDR